MIEDYFRDVGRLIAETTIVHSSSVAYDKRSTYVGSIRGELFFVDGSILHFREFVNVEHGVECYMYAYHYQRPGSALVFRYDNTTHFPTLPNFPHHKHDGSEVNVDPARPA